MKEQKQAAITVDIETDWGGRLPPTRENCKGITEGLPIILETLRRHKVKATFFVCAELLPEFRKELLRIKREGHEIGCHGLSHKDVSKLPKEIIEKEVLFAKKIIEKQLEVKVKGFRAPQFRTNKQLFDVLASNGFAYDSSKNRAFIPFRSKPELRYSQPYVIKEKLLEVPTSTIAFNMIPTGLLWSNLLGIKVFNFLTLRSNNPLIFYLHAFDVLEGKMQRGFGVWTGLFYKMKSKNAQKSLEGFIKETTSKGFIFSTVQELAERWKGFR